jgi:predicted metalloprotease with PDZ domain
MNARCFNLLITIFAFASSITVIGAGNEASYTITQTGPGSTSLSVKAILPSGGTDLQMQRTRPGDLPSVGKNGWPALVRDLHVTDSNGRELAVESKGVGGWALLSPYNGTLTLTYTLDYAPAATAGWPAPREMAFADNDHFSFSGRSLFITTPASSAADVTFVLPAGWQAVGPWPQLTRNKFRAATTADLVDNLIVLSSAKPDVVSAGSFRLFVTPMGKWMGVRPSIIKILHGVVPVYVSMMGDDEPGGSYSVVLLPTSDSGGESYRNSFAFNIAENPTKKDSLDWGHTIAHEIFHYWNGWRLRGTDYPSTQWFQEGFTDYAADIAMARSGSMTEGAFLRRIETDLDHYDKLTTRLDAPGTHKGPPLYGGGALVALCWDIKIRKATNGNKTLADVFRALWQRTEDGKKTYDWSDIKWALDQAAHLEWESFYQSYIHGSQKLPIGKSLSLAGLRLTGSGINKVETIPTASANERSLRKSLTGDRSNK